MRPHRPSNSHAPLIAQALVQPSTILLASLAHEATRPSTRGKQGIICQLVSPHGFSASLQTFDGSVVPCAIDVFQGLFSSSFACIDQTTILVEVAHLHIEIGPVIASDEQTPFNIVSVNRFEAKVHLQDGRTHIESSQSSAEISQVSFVAPRTALIQISEVLP
ncbi:MAG TPA: hypothetical protein VGL94_05380 [Ktedonobacteraceae bacterium]